MGKSLEHALLRSNPELEVLRPRHGDRDLSDSTEGDARGQNLVGDLNRDDDRDFAGRRHTRYADHARWQQLAQVGRNVGMHWGSPDEVDDFTVPASNTRVSSRAKPLCLQAVSCSHQATGVTRAG